MPAEPSATGLRSGACNDIVSKEGCSPVHAAQWGNWDFSSHWTMFTYMFHLIFIMMVAAAAMAGWPNVRKRIYQPSLQSIKINADMRGCVELRNFIILFFNLSEISGASIDEKGVQWLAWEGIFAGYLRWIPGFIIKFGENHHVVRILKENAQKSGVHFNTIIGWANAVQSDFQLNNASHSVSHEDKSCVTEILAYLQTQRDVPNSTLQGQLQILHTKVDTLAKVDKKVDTLGIQVDSLTKAVKSLIGILSNMTLQELNTSVGQSVSAGQLSGGSSNVLAPELQGTDVSLENVSIYVRYKFFWFFFFLFFFLRTCPFPVISQAILAPSILSNTTTGVAAKTLPDIAILTVEWIRNKKVHEIFRELLHPQHNIFYQFGRVPEAPKQWWDTTARSRFNKMASLVQASIESLTVVDQQHLKV